MEKESRFKIKLMGPVTPGAVDDNIDVEVHLEDGRRYSATFFTLGNLVSLFDKNRRTGECEGGLYLWASDMIIVECISSDVIERTVRGLLDDGELEKAFCRIL